MQRSGDVKLAHAFDSKAAPFHRSVSDSVGCTGCFRFPDQGNRVKRLETSGAVVEERV